MTPADLHDDDRLTHVPGVRLLQKKGRSALEQDGRPLVELDPMALALWELCDGETTVGEMVRAAGLLFDAPEHVLRSDISLALVSLRDAGFLSPSGPVHLH